MAKRIIDWTEKDGILSLNKYNSDKTAEVDSQKTFTLTEIYPTFLEMNEVQRHIIVYGAKQLLADSGASAVGDLTGKVDAAKEKWNFWKDGKLAGPRVNSTGASEAKQTVKRLTEISTVISLEGLLMKKVMKPGEFTEEDQEKLNEFLALAAKEAAKNVRKK